jgi:hypothetical protein
MLNSSIEKRDCENYLFADYHLKSGITVWILTLKISGSNVASWTLVCLKNRQVDPPWINAEYSKD